MNETSGRSPVVLNAQPAGDNTDTSTSRTVAMMCDCIRQSVGDPVVQQAAAYARDHFAGGRSDPASLAWAVFWYVKHCVRLRLDEATMFRIGARDEFDLLIAPSVLVRMKDPAEDCDGFTMLCLALFQILGVPCFIATAAVSPQEPWRWSHVFACALVNGSVVPIDASHMSGPGRMVPRSRIYRFQAWDLNARPVDIGLASFQGLHGYVKTRGMGDCEYEGDPTCSGPTPVSADPCPGGYLVDGVCQSSPAITPGIMPSGSTGSGFDLTGFFNSLFGNAAAVAKVATAPVPTYRLPDGTIVSGVPPSQLSSLTSSPLLPILGISLVAVLGFALVGSKKK